MDDDTVELITLLCTRIGMIMEDASVAALTISGLDHPGRLEAIAEIEAAVIRISALTNAVKALAD